MRILIVNIYFHPDPTGTGLVITELARDLVGLGHDVTVITSVPHYGGVRRKDEEADDGTGRQTRLRSGSRFLPQVWSESCMDGIRVIRTAVYVPRVPGFWTRALNYASFSVLAIAAGMRIGAQDVILCTSPPLTLGVSAWILSRLKRIPFVFNVQDIYPDVAVLMGMVRNPGLIALFRRLELFVYRKAARVTVISDGAKRNLLAKGVPDSKIELIPNWVDIAHVRPVEADNEFRRGLGLQGQRTVMFAGNIGLIAGLETVLEAAQALRHRSDIRFLIVGEGNAKAALLARARKMDLPNVTFLPTQPREILSEVLGAADLHLVTLRRQMSATSVPSKSYGIMASGRPMVAAMDPGSEVCRLVAEANAGICVPPEQPHQLARAIEALCDTPERRRVLGENARSYVVRYYAKEMLTERYARTLSSVAGSPGPGSHAARIHPEPLATSDARSRRGQANAGLAVRAENPPLTPGDALGEAHAE